MYSEAYNKGLSVLKTQYKKTNTKNVYCEEQYFCPLAIMKGGNLSIKDKNCWSQDGYPIFSTSLYTNMYAIYSSYKHIIEKAWENVLHAESS